MFVCSLDGDAQLVMPQSGGAAMAALDNCPEDLCPGDFLRFVVGFIHGNICFCQFKMRMEQREVTELADGHGEERRVRVARVP